MTSQSIAKLHGSVVALDICLCFVQSGTRKETSFGQALKSKHEGQQRKDNATPMFVRFVFSFRFN